MRRRWPVETKERAKAMRQQGITLDKISSVLDVPRGTVVGWVSSIPLPENRVLELRHLGGKRPSVILNTSYDKIISVTVEEWEMSPTPNGAAPDFLNGTPSGNST